MTDFNVGDRVKVEIPVFTAIVDHVGRDYVDVTPEDYSPYSLTGGDWPSCHTPEYIPTQFVSHAVENWPPQVGDVWEANGTDYYVRPRRLTVRDDEIVISRFDTSPEHDDEGSFWSGMASHMERFASLQPRLIRRRGQ